MKIHTPVKTNVFISVLPCSSPDDAGNLRNYITQYANHPNQFKYNGRTFASTFAGDTCQFGQDSVVDGWKTQFTQHPDVVNAGGVHFVPAFFSDPSGFGGLSGAVHGIFNVSILVPSDQRVID